VAEDALARFRRLRGLTAPAVEGAPPLAITPVALLRMFHVRGVRLRPMLTCVDVEDHAGVLTDDVRQAIRMHQTALLDLVEAVEERAAIAEYCGGLPRAKAEALAWACVLGGGGAMSARDTWDDSAPATRGSEIC
jgi:hypothetical protein